MDELSREGIYLREDEPLPADMEDLDTDGLQDGDAVTAHLIPPDPAVALASLVDYLDADAAADTDASPDEVSAAVNAAREDARQFGLGRRP